MENLEMTVFNKNKYYMEIIKSFIEEYKKEDTRVTVSDLQVELKVNDLVGYKIITFKEDENGRLKITINKNVDSVRYQDVIVYDDHGVIMERSSCMATIRKDINETFKGNLELLTLELNNLGENLSNRANDIYESINMKKIIRPENFGLEGKYIHKKVIYINGFGTQDLVEGKFKVLNSSSISSLEFPAEKDVIITRTDNYIIPNNYDYPTSRSL